MAVNLKMKKKCHIVAPEWLNVGKVCSTALLLPSHRQGLEYLTQRLELENTGDKGFSELPFRFAEIAKVLIDMYVS